MLIGLLCEVDDMLEFEMLREGLVCRFQAVNILSSVRNDTS